MPNADAFYETGSEQLLLYRDAEFTSLLNNVANYYSTINDQSIWGAFLSALASEMSRIEFCYAYDLVAKNPQYLTPPDIKRQYSGYLNIPGNYPQPTQFDMGDLTGSTNPPQYPIGFRDMCLDLIYAFRRGAVAGAISDVIYAYTGKSITVQQFYQNIPRKNGASGYYDASWRNTVGVAVNVGGSNTSADIQNLNQLQQVTQSLSGAMDLAKPAHVGIDLSISFGEGETLENYIMGLQDTLKITFKFVDGGQFNPMLYMAPIRNLKNPQTTLAAWGLAIKPTLTPAAWAALAPAVWSSATSYVKGAIVLNGLTVYRAKKASLNVEPNGTNTSWLVLSCPFPQQAYSFDGTNYNVGIAPWTPSTDVFLGQLVVDVNGNVQVAITAGTTGSETPIYSTFKMEVGGMTTEGSVTWECLGASPYTNPSTWILIVDKNGNPTGEVSNWSELHPAGLLAPRLDATWAIKNDRFNGDVF